MKYTVEAAAARRTMPANRKNTVLLSPVFTVPLLFVFAFDGVAVSPEALGLVVEG